MLKFCTALTVPAFMLYFIEDEHVYRYMEIVMYIVLVVLLKLFVFIIN